MAAGGHHYTERNATERNATERNATERNATERNATERNATERNATERNATERNATERNATERNATERNATERNATERNATERKVTERNVTYGDNRRGLLATCIGGATLAGLVAYHAAAGYYHYRYYVLRRHEPETWKCQPKSFRRPDSTAPPSLSAPAT